jgi:hypothetical protein
MQDSAGWHRRPDMGIVIFFASGHGVSEFENPATRVSL